MAGCDSQRRDPLADFRYAISGDLLRKTFGAANALDTKGLSFAGRGGAGASLANPSLHGILGSMETASNHISCVVNAGVVVVRAPGPDAR